MGGILSVGVGDDGGAGAVGLNDVVAPYSAGRVNALAPHDISIPPEQTFRGELEPRQSITLGDEVKAYLVLEGVYGREVL